MDYANLPIPQSFTQELSVFKNNPVRQVKQDYDVVSLQVKHY